MSPPEVLGSSTSSSPDNQATASSPATEPSSESQFVGNFIREVLHKHSPCIHFLDTPVSFVGECPETHHEDQYAITVKQLHLDLPLQFSLAPSSLIKDIVSAYEAEMSRLNQTPIPAVEQRWLYKGKPLLDTSIALKSLSMHKEMTLHLVRKVTTIPSKSEIDLLQALRAFERETNLGRGHSCTNAQCKSSLSFLLDHLRE